MKGARIWALQGLCGPLLGYQVPGLARVRPHEAGMTSRARKSVQNVVGVFAS